MTRIGFFSGVRRSGSWKKRFQRDLLCFALFTVHQHHRAAVTHTVSAGSTGITSTSGSGACTRVGCAPATADTARSQTHTRTHTSGSGTTTHPATEDTNITTAEQRPICNTHTGKPTKERKHTHGAPDTSTQSHRVGTPPRVHVCAHAGWLLPPSTGQCTLALATPIRRSEAPLVAAQRQHKVTTSACSWHARNIQSYIWCFT